MSIIISVMTGGSCGISGQKRRNRTDIPRHGKSMDVKTAVDAGIKPAVYTNTMRKRIMAGIK